MENTGSHSLPAENSNKRPRKSVPYSSLFPTPSHFCRHAPRGSYIGSLSCYLEWILPCPSLLVARYVHTSFQMKRILEACIPNSKERDNKCVHKPAPFGGSRGKLEFQVQLEANLLAHQVRLICHVSRGCVCWFNYQILQLLANTTGAAEDRPRP